MMRSKRIFTIHWLLVLSLIAGLALPAANADAAAKSKKKKVLVVYFSATGTTKSAAKKVKKAAGGKLYQIKPAKRYTDADLDYTNNNCRANREQRDEAARPQIKGKVKNIRKYDVIFLGFPIWHSREPKIIRTFLESYNLKGKKIVTFCTSGGSGISGSVKGIKATAKGARVVSGRDLTDVSYKSVKKWVKKQK